MSIWSEKADIQQKLYKERQGKKLIYYKICVFSIDFFKAFYVLILILLNTWYLRLIWWCTKLTIALHSNVMMDIRCLEVLNRCVSMKTEGRQWHIGLTNNPNVKVKVIHFFFERLVHTYDRKIKRIALKKYSHYKKYKK